MPRCPTCNCDLEQYYTTDIWPDNQAMTTTKLKCPNENCPRHEPDIVYSYECLAPTTTASTFTTITYGSNFINPIIDEFVVTKQTGLPPVRQFIIGGDNDAHLDNRGIRP